MQLPEPITDGDKDWTPEEEKFLTDNISTLALPDIYAHFSYRTPNCINIKIHRLRLPIKKGGMLRENVSRNILIEMISQRIGDPANFKPTREFLKRIEMGQKRWWQLYRGDKNMEEHEYRRLAKEWNITMEDAFEMRQLKIDF